MHQDRGCGSLFDFRVEDFALAAELADLTGESLQVVFFYARPLPQEEESHV